MPKETRMPEQAQEASDLPEPTHSETRPRQSGEAGVERMSRASIRPSAFGLPRSPYSSIPPPPAPALEARGPGRADDHAGTLAAPSLDAPRGQRAAAQPEAPPPPASRAILDDNDDDDETETRPALPRIQNERSRVVDRLTADPQALVPGASPVFARAPEGALGPRPLPSAAPASVPPAGSPTTMAAPAAPAAASSVLPPAGRTRRPWGSIALFSGMLLLSVVPLLRYARSHEGSKPAAPALALPPLRGPQPVVSSVAGGVLAQELSERRQAEAATDREQQLASLVAAGNRALETDAIPEAERLFGRVVELDEDNPRAAFGLARIRLLQGNLSGAEGWIQLALRRRPRRHAYHALYAEILTRLGRSEDAREEQRHAELKDGHAELKDGDDER